jgi:hypothetical protein
VINSAHRVVYTAKNMVTVPTLQPTAKTWRSKMILTIQRKTNLMLQKRKIPDSVVAPKNIVISTCLSVHFKRRTIQSGK